MDKRLRRKILLAKKKKFIQAQQKADSVQKRAARFRLLPVTLSLLVLLSISKGAEIYWGMQAIQTAEAAEEDSGKEDSGEGEEEKDFPVNQHGEKRKEKAVPDPVTAGTGKTKIKDIMRLKEEQATPKFSQVEVEILQDLKRRREKLSEREKEINLKIKVLDVAEKRLDERMEEMRALQRDLKIALGRYEKKQDEEIRGLVKIYENMKPGFAAAIFNELDLPILLSVVDKMSERKVAPILAAMLPNRAKEVTEELAELRKLRRIQSEQANALAGEGG